MISLEEIDKLAELSRIELNSEEKDALRKDMGSVLEYVEQINKVSANLDLDKKAGLVRNVMREDENSHEGGIFTEILLSSAPKRQGNYFKVKKIL